MNSAWLWLQFENLPKVNLTFTSYHSLFVSHAFFDQTLVADGTDRFCFKPITKRSQQYILKYPSVAILHANASEKDITPWHLPFFWVLWGATAMWCSKNLNSFKFLWSLHFPDESGPLLCLWGKKPSILQAFACSAYIGIGYKGRRVFPEVRLR